MTHEFDQSLLTEFYSKLYGGNAKHDSPEFSRIRMIRYLASELSARGEKVKILNVGAGRQSLEKQFLTAYRRMGWIKNLSFVTVDIANIIQYKLLAAHSSTVRHVQANALQLPYPDDTFDFVISNLAIDFLPHSAIGEASRVLKKEGDAVFHFHHPTLTDNPPVHPSIVAFWSYLRTNNVLFQNEQQIHETLQQYGLQTHSTHIATDGIDRWWEVHAKKSA